jgi:hypothetical protein
MRTPLRAPEALALARSREPACTLSAYVHLMDEGVGNAELFDTAIASAAPATAPHLVQRATA